MTVQDIIKQTKTFTPEEKQELAYYFLFSAVDKDKRKNFANLLHYEDDAETSKKPLENFMKSKGILKDIDLSDITEEDLYLQKD